MTGSKFKDALEGLGGAAFIAIHLLLNPILRRWRDRWGATEAEVNRPLPGDELVHHPKWRYTHAVTIHAPAEKVWPWLGQIGQGRGGLYSYEWLENLAGCDMHNADRIVPEHQLKVGDGVRLGPKGYPLYKVAAIESYRALVLVGADPKTEEVTRVTDPMPTTYTNGNWVFVLKPIDDHTTRLLVRGLLDYAPDNFANTLIWRVMTEPIGFVMERKMLLGIKQRAEAATARHAEAVPA